MEAEATITQANEVETGDDLCALAAGEEADDRGLFVDHMAGDAEPLIAVLRALSPKTRALAVAELDGDAALDHLSDDELRALARGDDR